MIVEELVTKLGLEVDSGALATLEKFRNAVAGGLSTLTAAAVGLGAAFVGIVGSTAHAADSMGDMADKLGVNAQALQELRVAAELGDVSFESLATGLKFVAKNAAEAAHGSTEAADAFKGIATHDANGKLKTADELLMSVAKRFETVTQPAEQTRLAMKLFGKSGADLIPLLKRGAAGILEFRKEAQELGVVFGDEALKNADDFGREMVRVKFALEGLRNTFATPFLGAFVEGVRLLVKGFKAARPAIAEVSAGFKDAGQRMGGMLGIVKQGINLFGEWFGDSSLGKILGQVKVIKILEAVLIGLGVIFVATAAQAIGAWLAAAAPFILLGALIGFIVDDIYNFIKGNDSLIGRIQKWAEAIGEPDEHPLVRMLRKALGLLMDVTNPKRWDEFKEAAGGAVDFVSEKIRLALGGKKFTKTNPYAYGQLVPEDYKPAEPEQGGIFGQGGLFDRFGFQRRGFEDAVRSGAATEPGMNKGGPSGIHLQAPAASFAPVNNITVNASGMTPEQGQKMVEDALNASYSKAMPAVSGGEK